MGRPASLAGHVIIETEGGSTINCTRCKNKHRLTFPMNARKLITQIESYMELHRDCPDPKQSILHGVSGG